jgi:hypothetical protein
MTDFGPSDLPARYARLTALLEDAAGQAVEGQDPSLTDVQAEELRQRLGKLIEKAAGVLAGIEALGAGER